MQLGNSAAVLTFKKGRALWTLHAALAPAFAAALVFKGASGLQGIVGLKQVLAFPQQVPLHLVLRFLPFLVVHCRQQEFLVWWNARSEQQRAEARERNRGSP